MNNYHIAVIAPPWYPVPPIGYGGIELVVDLQVRGLRALGCEVTLFGAEGSLPGTVVLAPSEWSADLGRTHHEAREVTYVAKVLDELNKINHIDIVQDHAGFASLLALSAWGKAPIVHTVHGPIYEQQRTVYESLHDTTGLIAISDNQKNSAPSLKWAGRAYNAVDIDTLHIGTREDKEPYLFCLARISPEKGQHLAIEVAKRSGLRLVMAGKVGEQDSEQKYFDECVAPFIDGDKVMYLPNVVGEEKARLLSHAKALLAPLTWPEPFGLAMVEAMVSGTPVIALKKGSASELITNGVTGFVVDTVDEMVQKVKEVSTIDPVQCAHATRKVFSPQSMAMEYLKIYQSYVCSRRAIDIQIIGFPWDEAKPHEESAVVPQ